MALADPLRATSPTVEVGGQSYPLLQRNLSSMIMREALGGLSSLEMVFIDNVEDAGTSRYAAGPGSPLELGAGIRVFAGPHEVGAPEVFDGQITAIEAEIGEDGPPVFTALAEDRLFPARRRRRTHLYEAMALGDVVSAIASDYGLTPQVRDGVDTTARNWFQADETDLGFLRRILARYDCDMQVVGAKLEVGRIARDQRSAITLAMGDTLLSARITADIAEQVTTITLGSFDPGAGQAVNTSQDAQPLGPGSGQSGPDTLRAKFAAVTMHAGRDEPMTDADGDARARIEAARRARGFVRVTGSAKGDGNLRVGSWVTLAGVNPRFAGTYAVREVTHRFGLATGYRVDFLAESAWLGAPQ